MSQSVPLEALLGPRMTLDEWAELPDAVPGEFVDGRLVEEEMPDLVHEVISSSIIPGIFSSSDVRRFWVLASFSLRSDAHVATYAPLRCSRKPRQNAKLGGRGDLKRLGMVHLLPAVRSACARSPDIYVLPGVAPDPRAALGRRS